MQTQDFRNLGRRLTSDKGTVAFQYLIQVVLIICTVITSVGIIVLEPGIAEVPAMVGFEIVQGAPFMSNIINWKFNKLSMNLGGGTETIDEVSGGGTPPPKTTSDGTTFDAIKSGGL